MKKLTMCILMVLLSGCSNLKTSLVIKEEMLIGTWECVSFNHDSSLEGQTTYFNEGGFDKQTTMRQKVADVKGEFLYQVNSSGTWKLKGNTVHETMGKYELIPLNELSIAFEDVIKKKLDQYKKSYLTVVTIDESKINWMGNGIPMSCNKVVK
tara:strand:- start:53788 stop:54246 length:459 start_codon:yes stop_codon:yes gene_type:complete